METPRFGIRPLNFNKIFMQVPRFGIRPWNFGKESELRPRIHILAPELS